VQRAAETPLVPLSASGCVCVCVYEKGALFASEPRCAVGCVCGALPSQIVPLCRIYQPSASPIPPSHPVPAPARTFFA
jgi:hypothetical protein